MSSKPSTQEKQPNDLLIIPQAKAAIPNENLAPADQNAVVAAWETYGTTTEHSNTEATWKVAICHIRNAAPRITTVLTIPRIPAQPAPRPATHADNAASTPTLSAPQSA